MKTEHLTIMFTDIKGFTSQTSKKSRKEIETLLELHDSLLRPIFSKFNGNVIKTIGDAFLVTFKSPTDAVLCGIEIQKELNKYNEKVFQDEHAEDERLEVRIAINTGEVNIRKNDVFGEPVNIAARIEGIAEPGEIYFTEAVYLSMNKKEIPSAEIGHKYLKGIPNEIKVYKVLTERKLGKSKKISLLAKKRVKKKKWLIIAGIIAALLLLFLLLANFGGDTLQDKTYERPSINEQIQQWNKEARNAIRKHDAEKASKLLNLVENSDIEKLPANTLLLGSRLLEVLNKNEDIIQVLRLAIQKDLTRKQWQEVLRETNKISHEPGKKSKTGKEALEIAEIAEKHLN